MPRRARLPVAASALAVLLIAFIVAPVFYGGYTRGGTVSASSRSAWDIGYAYAHTFPDPDALLAAAPFDPATMTLLRTSFRQPHTPPPPDAPAAAWDAYVLAITYTPKFETASSPPSSIVLGLALYAFGAYNNGSRLAACCGYDGMNVQANGVDLPVLFDRAIPWLAQQETMLVPTSARSALNYYPLDAYIGQLSLDISFTAGGVADVFSATHIPWGVVALAPPTTLDVRVSVVLERHVPVPFIVVKFKLQRTMFTKVLSIFVCAVMWALALSVFLVAVDTLFIRPRADASNLSSMAAAFAALFALTPLRNTQNGIPPPMAAIDMWGFLWCMILVAISALLQGAAYFAYAKAERWDAGGAAGGEDGDASLAPPKRGEGAA